MCTVYTYVPYLSSGKKESSPPAREPLSLYTSIPLSPSLRGSKGISTTPPQTDGGIASGVSSVGRVGAALNLPSSSLLPKLPPSPQRTVRSTTHNSRGGA